MIWLAVAAMAAAFSADEGTEQADPAPVVFERQDRVGPYYPAVAAQNGVTGFAILDCSVADNGVLKGCQTVEESPKGENFGAAAQVMAMRKRIRAAEPYTVGQRLKVRVPFELRR
jgi:TonB family protein